MSPAPTTVARPFVARRAAGTSAIALAVLLTVGGLTACSSSLTTGGAGSTGVASEQPAESAAPAAPAEEPEPGIGQVVKAGDLEFTVIGIEEAGTSVGDQYLSQTAQGRYVAVTLKVANVGSQAATFFSDNVQLVDSSDRTFDSDSTATLYAAPDSDAWLNEINPGNAFEGRVLFDLPADATPAAVIVKDSAFAGGERIRLQ